MRARLNRRKIPRKNKLVDENIRRKDEDRGTCSMTSVQWCAVYNSPVPLMSIFSPRTWQQVSLLVAILVLLSWRAVAEDWTTPEQELAKKIAALTGPGAIAIAVANQSSLGQKDVDQISNGFRSRLEAFGVRAVKEEQAAA